MNLSSHHPVNGERHRVLIVDDHPLVLRGLATLLSETTDLQLCGDAADGPEALRLAAEAAPDVVIVDLMLDGENGIEVIEKLKAQHPQLRILVSSMQDETLFAERALRAGALGFVSKREPLRQVVEAVRHVLRGEIYLSSRMANRLLHRVVADVAPQRSPIESLSNRELEVFEMIGQGLTTQQIAGKLQLSPKTIETHRKKIKDKLNVKNSLQLSRCAFQWIQEKR